MNKEEVKKYNNFKITLLAQMKEHFPEVQVEEADQRIVDEYESQVKMMKAENVGLIETIKLRQDDILSLQQENDVLIKQNSEFNETKIKEIADLAEKNNKLTIDLQKYKKELIKTKKMLVEAMKIQEE